MSWFSVQADPGPQNAELAEDKAQFDKDEIRRRRLASLGGTPSTEAGMCKSPEKPVVKRERVEDQSEVQGTPVRQSKSPEDRPLAPSVPAMAAVGSPLKSPSRTTVRALTYALEQIFQLSLRPECDGSVRVLEDVDSTDGNFDSLRVSELVCAYISSDDSISAVTYLIGCYKRLCQKQLTAADAQKTEFENCREQIIRFLVSCLSEPDIFGSQSSHSISDFIRYVGSEFNISAGIGMLRHLADELELQNLLDEVCMM